MRLAAARRSIDRWCFLQAFFFVDLFSGIIRCANKAVFFCSSDLDAFMQQFVCIHLSEHQTNHVMLSESLTTLDIAWPLFQAVRSLVLSSYVIFLQRLRRGKAHQGFPSIKKLISVVSQYIDSLSELFLFP